IIGNPSLNHRYRKGFYSLFKTLQQNPKGPDSVEYGEKWLDDLDAIYIDPIRTPNIAKEFENIDYQTDRDGNPKPRLEDKDNHTIDATRYAFNDDMRKQPEPVNVKKTIDTFKKLGL
ncbi:terminase large subunit, partial [Enterococcus faecium]|uniref:terminase large subunit n=1 Tax=Enterococcus faecium TaxID=1352 RepID=UPI00313AD38E